MVELEQMALTTAPMLDGRQLPHLHSYFQVLLVLSVRTTYS